MSASRALSAALLMVRLAPPLRDALTDLVRAVVAGQPSRARLALEAAHAARAALVAGGHGALTVGAPLARARPR